jgi:hypothetical protein
MPARPSQGVPALDAEDISKPLRRLAHLMAIPSQSLIEHEATVMDDEDQRQMIAQLLARRGDVVSKRWSGKQARQLGAHPTLRTI